MAGNGAGEIAQATRVPVMTPGEPFKPIGLRKSSKGKLYPPAIVDRQRDIADGEKRLYRLLYSRAQTNPAGTCWPGFKSLACDLGKSERQVKYDAKRLEEKRRLLRHRRRGARQSNMYEFLWHAMFEVQSTALHGGHEGKPPEVQPIAPREATPEVQSPTPEVQVAANPKCSALHTNSLRECSQKTPSSSAPQQTPGADGDDDASSIKTKQEQNTVEGIMLSFIKECGYMMPSGPLRDGEIAKKLHEIGGEPRDVQEFLHKKFRPRLKDPPNTWTYITTAIMRHLCDAATARDILSRKQYGEQEAKRRIEADLRRQAEEEEQRRLNELVAPETAIQLVREHWKEPLPEVLVKHLLRLAQSVSASEIRKQAKAWKKGDSNLHCKNCRDSGLVGSAVKGTLQFCSCVTGEELQAEHGDSFLADRIAHANANLPARIAAASEELGFWPITEALKRCHFVDADAIKVTVSAKDRIYIRAEDIREILDYIGDQRKVVVKYESETAQPEGPPQEPNIFDHVFDEPCVAECELAQRAGRMQDPETRPEERAGGREGPPPT